jgi:hypothetical protein
VYRRRRSIFASSHLFSYIIFFPLQGGLSKEFQRNIDATDIAPFARPRYAATCAMSKCHHRGEVPEVYVRIRARTSYSVSFNPGSWGEQKTAFGRSLCRGAIGALAVASALQHYSNAHTSRCRPCGRKIARSAQAAVACVFRTTSALLSSCS